ncbi:elongation factor 3 [Psychromicrobium lacuslunae]|uniref:Elongation factor 3 n=1 Tax=Psychromicrobium lacuslunae TaxID=1618207 RepID=A0A0D4C3V4_9MICC|nr:elongation factor 3 [Psychromicrobium lacuslunae]
MAQPIALRQVSHGYGNRLLFEQLDLTIAPGEHVVVIGENGSGKSTLLRILAGLEKPDKGELSLPQRPGYLSQALEAAAGLTVAQAIDQALADLRSIAAEIQRLSENLADATAETNERYDQLVTSFALRGGYQADARIDAALNNLGLAGLARDRPLDSLSGGERERFALACLLADPAPVLLLDEPSNHLDAAGLDWLEARLAAHHGTVVVVSHDRQLLDNLAQTVIEVDADKTEVRRYGNGYQGYLVEKKAERARWEQAYQQWLDAMAKEREKAVEGTGRNGYGRVRDKDKMAFDFKTGTVEAAVSSQIRNAQERLRRLEENPIDKPPQPLRLAARLGGSAASGAAVMPSESVLRARDLLIPGQLEVPEFALARQEKVLISGPNGAGKTTLLELLSGNRKGVGEVHAVARIGYLPQEVPAPPRPEQRLLPAFAEGRVGSIEEHAENLLRLGVFRSADFTLPVGGLSLGQRRRLALARLLLDEYSVLMIDEPTNHLAPQLVDELQELFTGFAGALLLVSHDRVLRRWFETLPQARQEHMQAGRMVSSDS